MKALTLALGVLASCIMMSKGMWSKP